MIHFLINFAGSMLMRRSFFVLICLFALSSCGEYGKVLKSGTPDEKYTLALKLYQKKDYIRALPLFEELLNIYRGTDKSEEVYYYYSYSHYGMGNYELAAYHFKNYTETFYNSKHQEECSYMYAYCIYKDALPYFLDQTSTIRGIAELQLFLNLYPQSTYRESCNNAIDELRKKLHQKAYHNAMLYYKIEDYRAASVAFKNALKDYPDIDRKEEIEYMIVRSSYLFAKHSVEDKKQERYNQVFEEFNEFAENNKPGSEYYDNALEIVAKTRQDLEKHKKLQKQLAP